jgi:FHA domain
VPDPVLTLLKYVFLAILYLFFLRVLRAVWVEVREPKPGQPTQAEPGPPDPTQPPAAQYPAAPFSAGQYPGPWAPAPSGALQSDITGTVGMAGAFAATGSVTPLPKLVVVAPPDHQGREFTLGDEVTVGRAGGCAVLLDDDTFVSQLHARIFRRDGDLHIEDLGSTNGTYLNQRKVGAAMVVRPGDQVQVGRTTLELRE